MPIRIQRKRSKGWRMPAGTVYVGRGSRWGNPWKVGETATTEIPESGIGPLIQFPARAITAEFAVEQYRRWMQPCTGDIRTELRGQDLACWCRLDQPCHADVLLELANPPPTTVNCPICGTAAILCGSIRGPRLTAAWRHCNACGWDSRRDANR